MAMCGKLMAGAKRLQREVRPDTKSGKMKQVMHYATSGKVRTAGHLKQGVSKPGS